MTSPSSYRLEYQLIKEAAKHGELVIFVGAGASMLCGSPDWSGFAKQVVGVLEKNGALSFLEAEQLKGLGDARRTLSIAMALAKDSGVHVDFDSILHPDAAATAGAELYEILSSLRPVFVTTNYDRWLDKEGPQSASEAPQVQVDEPTSIRTERTFYYRKEHLTPDRLAERGAVIHLHGSYVEPGSMVVSLKDYIEHYADSRVQSFLADMFRSYTVLFVGYGLAELEVLDYVIRSNESLRANVGAPRHFLLYPYRSSESAQRQFIERFFRDQCGVQVIPYCIDMKGYGELVDVFKSWVPQLDVRDPTILDLQGRIDQFVAVAGPNERKAAIGLIARHPELSAYFINKLKDPVWFEELESSGFFNPEHNPPVKLVQQENGIAYQADGWPALRYLEHVTSLVDEERAKRIANIVRAISAHSLEKNIDNWRTFWSLATVTAALPTTIVTEGDIQMARSWLASKSAADMVGHEIGVKLLPRLLESSDPSDWNKAMLMVDALTSLRPEEKAE